MLVEAIKDSMGVRLEIITTERHGINTEKETY